jgi:hypothetical protein
MDQGKQIKIEFVVTEITLSYAYNSTHTCFDVDALRKIINSLIGRL